MKEKVNQMFKDKLFLVMLVLGLLTIVAAAGVITVQRGKGNETNPYLEVPQPEMIAQETAPEMPQVAGASDAAKETQKSRLLPRQPWPRTPTREMIWRRKLERERMQLMRWC